MELYLAGAHGVKREIIIELETSALTPEKGEIIHFYAVNRWDKEDELGEWARPSSPLSPAAEQVLCIINHQLAHCRAVDAVLTSYLANLFE